MTQPKLNYILITPARNEETFIEKTIQSMIAQTHLPEKWVVVDDGSTDRTPEILNRYAPQHPWIHVVTRPQHLKRSFAGKVHAFNAGLESVKDLEFEVLGNLDADLSFDPDYFDFIMKQFTADPKLGVGGTPFTQDGGYDSAKDSFEGENYVAGGAQLFRRRCFEEVGGYVPNPAGGVDWIAVMSARMKGWKVQSFPQKRFHHYRTLGTAERGQFSALYSYGERAYYLGGSPIWQLFRSAYRSTKKPYVLGGVCLFLGYFTASARRMKRPVSRDMIRFHRRDQMAKLRAILGSLLRFKKVDHFRVATEDGGGKTGDRGR